MTAGVQCDTCRTFTPEPSGQWLHLVPHPDPVSSILSSVLGSRSGPSASFCSVQCLAEYAIARALVEGYAAGEEP